ncbi:MAG TPA: DUF3352 domain-containing protein, partial [Chthoniobacterales bacterium]|nr:DUF3352 domain-containing protein [Chthoniobacterales bacterium]
MRKFQLLILAAAVAAGAIWWGFYRTHHTSSLGVASLLPKDTLALVHLPDFNRSRGDWHRTDLYQLWQEPSVQEFLQKPRANLQANGRISQTVDEISSLEMKDAFFAVISIESSTWKWDGGFRCSGDNEKAAKLVEDWRMRMLGGGRDTNHEIIDYQGRQIHNDSAGIVQVWTVWAGPWFFFANDIANLKTLLDRADGRVKDPATALSADETFLGGSKHMPASYSALVFARVAQFAEKISSAEESDASDKLSMVRQIRSFGVAMAFDGGRMRDTVFVGMPRAADLANLTRGSLSIASKDTFLYAASIVDWRKEMEPGWQSPALGWLSGLHKIIDSLGANGITLEEWKSAFGSEVALIASWPANSQWPSVVAATAVNDPAKANNIVNTITSSPSDDLEWSRREKDGVHYYSSSSGLPLFSFSPTIGLSDRMLVIGLDSGSVEAAMKHSANGSSELAATRNYQNADRAVATPQQAFVYLDPALIYARFDTSLRPLLAMGAAFLPALSDTVDVSKLPPAEIVARHLSPTVMSQSYRGDG